MSQEFFFPLLWTHTHTTKSHTRSTYIAGMSTVTHSRQNSTTRSDNRQPKSADSHKRALSPESDTENYPQKTTNKRTRTTKMTSKDIDELKKLILASSASAHQSLSQQIESSRESLESKFNGLENNINIEISALKSSVQDFKSSINTDLNDINHQLSNHEQRINNTEDDIQRMKRSSDLRVVGLPVRDNENLLELFEQIAREIGYNVSPHAIQSTISIERLYMKSRTTGQMVLSGTILIHFALLKHKQTFYSCYLNKMPLVPEKFGLPVGHRIVIGEHLTKTNAQIFKSAQLMKKDNKIAQVYTEDGLVKLKLNKGKREPTHVVRSVIELELVVKHFEAQTQSYTPPQLHHHNHTTTFNIKHRRQHQRITKQHIAEFCTNTTQF